MNLYICMNPALNKYAVGAVSCVTSTQGLFVEIINCCPNWISWPRVAWWYLVQLLGLSPSGLFLTPWKDARSSNSLYDSAQICSAVTLLGSFQSDFWQPWLSKKDPVQQTSLSVQVRFCWPWLSCTVSIIGHHPDQEVVHNCGYLCMIKCQCLSRRSRVSCRPVFFWGGGGDSYA